jgi:hypothetical protein
VDLIVKNAKLTSRLKLPAIFIVFHFKYRLILVLIIHLANYDKCTDHSVSKLLKICTNVQWYLLISHIYPNVERSNWLLWYGFTSPVLCKIDVSWSTKQPLVVHVHVRIWCGLIGLHLQVQNSFSILDQHKTWDKNRLIYIMINIFLYKAELPVEHTILPGTHSWLSSHVSRELESFEPKASCNGLYWGRVKNLFTYSWKKLP